MKSRTTIATIASALCLFFGAALQAGYFNPTTVFYKTQLSNTSIYVIVEGHAQYVGSPDGNDSHALIQTTEYDTWQGGAGNAGAGYNKNGPFFTGQVISCTDAQGGCPGRGYVPRKPCSASPYYYSGRTGATIYHQYSPEIRLLYGPINSVPCIPETPGPCGFDPWADEAVLPVFGGPQVVNAFSHNSFALRRTEERDGFRYLLDDWALLVVDHESKEVVPDVAVLAASSTAYGDLRRKSLVNALEDSGRSISRKLSEIAGRGSLASYFRPGRSVMLVIAAPVHVHNKRWVPTPIARLAKTAMSRAAEPGSAVVRLDFGENRSLIDFEVLYSDRLLSPDERDFIRENLRLEYASEKPHRAVLFAVVSLGETVELLRGRVVLPQCCGCPPNSATCGPSPPR